MNNCIETCGDDPENLIIQGDNLQALKSLLPRYAGKVDLVFIQRHAERLGDWNVCYGLAQTPGVRRTLDEWLDGRVQTAVQQAA